MRSLFVFCVCCSLARAYPSRCPRLRTIYSVLHREQQRGGRCVTPREDPEDRQGLHGLLRAQHRPARVWPQGDRDRRAGDARDHGATQARQGRQGA